jgi:hypothetical protein
MNFPYCDPHLTPGGHDVNKFDFELCVNFPVNFSISNSVVLEILDFKMTPPHFCDYLSFDKDWAGPSFVQTWIPSMQGWFVHSLIKNSKLVLEKIFKEFFPI